MAVATTLLLTWHLSRPALWFDEGASVTATQRTWPNLFRLLHGTDAPLVPYYAVLKASTGLITQVYPGAAAHPEWLFRLPSVVAVVAAVWMLTAWLARFCPARVVLGTGAVLLLTVSISRYGQEARPYPFVLLAAVLSTIVWAWAIRHSRRGPVLLYALSVVVLMAANPLAGSLLAAHLVTALSLDRGERWRAALRTVVGGAIGGVVVLPFVLVAMTNGGGPLRDPVVTPDLLRRTFVQLFTSDRTPAIGVGYLMILSLIGAVRVIDHRYRFIARLALAWAVVPPLVLLPAVMVRPGLLIARYLLFVVPGWAVLGGLGIATIVDVTRRLVRMTLDRPLLGNLAALVAVLAVLAGLAVTQLPSQRLIRTSHGHGHGVDPRPALQDLREPALATLPVIVTTRSLGLQINTYDRAAAARTIGFTSQLTDPDIWPRVPSAAAARDAYRQVPRAVALIEPGTLARGCRKPPKQQRVAWAQRCLPLSIKQAGFEVESVQVHGRDIVTEVLGRPAPTAGL